MEKELVAGQLGPEAKYSLVFKDGKLCAEVVYDSAILDGGIVLKLDSDAVLEAIKAAIPGKIDDSVIDLLKVALKAVA